MDICSFANFHDALRSPDPLLRTLRDIDYEPESLTSTKYFAEGRANIGGRRAMIYAPITPQSMALANHAATTLRATEDTFGSMEILSEELLCGGSQPHYCSLIIEWLPAGIPLREALYTHSQGNLLQGLTELRNRLKLYGLSHNHLTPNNIVVDTKRVWHTIRNYYTTTTYGGDEASFEHLVALIKEHSLHDSMELHDRLSPYSTSSERHALIGRRRRVETPRGVGFEDENGVLVIEDIYLSAIDFLEDRSRVVTKEHKVGLIDKRGHYVIAPIYDDIEYDVDDGSSQVRLKDSYAEFDYLGKQVTEWHK